MFYKDKDVIVVGGGNSALTESLYLSNICKKVTIIIRRDNFTGDKYLIDRVSNKKNIKVINNSNIISYNVKNNILVSVTLDNKKEGQNKWSILSHRWNTKQQTLQCRKRK